MLKFISDTNSDQTCWRIRALAGTLTIFLLALLIYFASLTHGGWNAGARQYEVIKTDVTIEKAPERVGKLQSMQTVSLPRSISETSPALASRSQLGTREELTPVVEARIGNLHSRSHPRRTDAQVTQQFVAARSIAVGDSYMKSGDYANALAAYEHALSIDPEAGKYAYRIQEARKSLVLAEVYELLRSLEAALENEDMQRLTSVFDGAEADFVEQQKAKAKRLFRHFENITSTFSNVNIRDMDENHLAVELRCRIGGFRRGRSLVLFDEKQDFAFKKVAGDVWKIYSIE